MERTFGLQVLGLSGKSTIYSKGEYFRYSYKAERHTSVILFIAMFSRLKRLCSQLDKKIFSL